MTEFSWLAILISRLTWVIITAVCHALTRASVAIRDVAREARNAFRSTTPHLPLNPSKTNHAHISTHPQTQQCLDQNHSSHSPSSPNHNPPTNNEMSQTHTPSRSPNEPTAAQHTNAQTRQHNTSNHQISPAQRKERYTLNFLLRR